MGAVIGPEEIKMEEEKVKEMLEQPIPKEVKDVHKFLGLTNYYQWFINNFSAIARLLHNLVKKNQKWDWTERQEKIFQELKKKFIKEPVLAVLDLDKKISIKVDTLDYIIGGVLSRSCEDGKQRLVVFLSKSLSKIERNYKIYDKEMLVMPRQLENWRHLLKGAKYKFKVWTNYKNLEYFMKKQKLNRRQAC